MPSAVSKKPSDRTHEENQERAYIAASRRSDRSVEARVESARRASEIHKRRTGKALKVTEKDVLAEEMYEEEDDELPSQYKNLNAHLQTGSTDFDARLQAYLANAVAFRKALSGVAKNRDKVNNVDFVNTRQLADHQALFPKHSDAWKDVVIPKSSTDAPSSPFLPQNASIATADIRRAQPYTKSSSLSNRRQSMSKPVSDNMNSMGTLRDSDLKPRTTAYRPTARHSSLPKSKPMDRPHSASSEIQQEDFGINYASLNYESSDKSPSMGSDVSNYPSSPFSSRLPANAIDMLLPWNQAGNQSETTEQQGTFDNSFLYDASLFHPKPQDTIDATLYGSSSQKDVSYSTLNEYAPQSYTNWQTPSSNLYKESSASRKLVEDNMWGNFIEEPEVSAWEWTTPSC